MSGTEGPKTRGRLPERWKDRMKEYMSERVTSRGEEPAETHDEVVTPPT